MVQIIAFIIFIISLFVIGLVLYKKVPILVELPQNGYHGFKKPELVKETEKKIKDIYFHFFEKQVLLQKVLSKFRVLILKTERIIDNLLHGIRKKAQQLDRENGKK